MIPEIHPSFKLNGHSLNREGVMIVAYSYVKEGAEWEKEIGDFLLNWLDDFDVMTVYTSGSTGVPKEFKLQKQHMINSAHLTGAYFNLGPGAEVLCCLPLSYIAGKMMMVRALTLGWEIDLIKPSTKPLKKATKRYDFTAMTPHQVHKSIKHIYKTRKVLIGGASVSDQLIEALDGRHSRAFHSYGMTETASHVAIRSLYPVKEDCFTALKDVKLSKDDKGCLVIDAPLVASKQLVTNDLVELISETQFNVLGRVDDVINSGGVKIHPAMVEKKLAQQLSQRFFITDEKDDELGECVVLIIEGKEEDVQLDLDQLEDYEKPKSIYYVDTFEETHTKKVDKRSTIERINRKVK